MSALKFAGIAAVAGMLLTSCASAVHIEKDDSANLSSYNTYAWVEMKTEAKDSTTTPVSDLTERRIREAVNTELGKAGWKQVKTRPDVLLSYDVLVERGVKENSSPVYSQPTTRYYFNPYSRRWNTIYYPSQFLGYDNQQESVKEGTVTISLIDARSEKTVWQGWTTDEVNSRNLTSKEIRSAVKNIFKKFDVAKN